MTYWAAGAALGSALYEQNRASSAGSGNQTGITSQQQYMKSVADDARAKKMRNILGTGGKVMGNIDATAESQLALFKGGLQPRIENMERGVQAAQETRAGGARAATSYLTGVGTPDMSFATPDPLERPDLSFLEDFELPELDTELMGDWMPRDEYTGRTEAERSGVSYEEYLARMYLTSGDYEADHWFGRSASSALKSLQKDDDSEFKGMSRKEIGAELERRVDAEYDAEYGDDEYAEPTRTWGRSVASDGANA